VTTLTSSYIDQNVDMVVPPPSRPPLGSANQLATLKDELEKGELALHEYKTEQRLLSVSFRDQ